VTATAEAPLALAPTSVRRRTAGVALAVVGGVALAAQSRINGELAVRLHDAVAAATVSFGSGLLVLIVIVAVLPPARRGVSALRAALAVGRIRWWQLAGGTCGAFLVASQGLAVATLGVAVFIVALVAGQSISGLVVDRLGAAPGGARPVTVTRLAGAVLTVLAVLLAVADRLTHPGTLGLAVLPLVAGSAIAWQQAVNGHVRMAADSALVAGLVNFTVGTAVLLLAAAATWAFRGLPGRLPVDEWWLYAGGPLGIVFIALGAAVVRHTGVLLLGLGMIAGQITGALVVDLVAPPATGGPGGNTLAGAALTLLAVAVAALPAGAIRR
jgi:transporter family-2 protein